MGFHLCGFEPRPFYSWVGVSAGFPVSRSSPFVLSPALPRNSDVGTTRVSASSRHVEALDLWRDDSCAFHRLCFRSDFWESRIFPKSMVSAQGFNPMLHVGRYSVLWLRGLHFVFVMHAGNKKTERGHVSTSDKWGP